MLEWWSEQSSWVRFGLPVAIITFTLILWFGFDIFWPWGFLIGTALAVLGLISAL